MDGALSDEYHWLQSYTSRDDNDGHVCERGVNSYLLYLSRNDSHTAERMTETEQDKVINSTIRQFCPSR